MLYKINHSLILAGALAALSGADAGTQFQFHFLSNIFSRCLVKNIFLVHKFFCN